MFERYTEKARRTIFFARYEAAKLGSPYIETEHLLLGLWREEQANMAMLLGKKMPDALEAVEHIRKEIAARTFAQKPISTSVDLPLSDECKRVLAYAAEEAERLQHRHIGSEHLLLGLMRERGCFAAELLRRLGLTIEGVRKRIGNNQPSTVVGSAHVYIGEDLVFIRGEGWAGDYVRSKVTELRRFAWIKQDYQPRDLLIERGTGRVMFYSGQQYDPERFELGKGAWSLEHCAICRWELSREAGTGHETGYTNGQDWLCTVCHDQFLAIPNDPRDDVYT